jgi:hypothetical protein
MFPDADIVINGVAQALKQLRHTSSRGHFESIFFFFFLVRGRVIEDHLP